MQKHLPAETLSAYIDGEPVETERAEIERHLALCEECSGVKKHLGTAAAALAAMDAVIASSDEHRSLRQAILSANPGALRDSSQPRRLFARINWAVAGLACIVIAGASFAAVRFLPDAGPETQEAAPADYNAFLDASAYSLASDREVRDAVTAMPEVNQAAIRTGRQPAGTTAAEDSAAADGSSFSSQAPEQARAAAPADQTGAETLSASGPFSPERASECLVKVQASQPYRMAPLMVRAAQFKGNQAWLLAFAWTPSADPQAPLDQIQVWMFSPNDCASLAGDDLIATVLHYSSFRQN